MKRFTSTNPHVPIISARTVSIFHILMWMIQIICGLTQDEVREQLLDKYQTKVPPPMESPDKPVKVGVGITVNYFTLEEAEHVFLVNSWIRMTWKDTRLAFDSSNTNGTMLRFGSDELWVPDLTLYNNAFPTEIDHYGDTHLLVSPDGTVLWIPPSRLAAHCSLNMIRWPYDTQTCELKFGSWTHHGKEVDLYFIQTYNESQGSQGSSLEIEHTNYVSNSEWVILNNSAVRNAVFYSCCPEPYVDITFSFTFQRISPSYTAIFVVPIIMISLVNMLIFLLPPAAGEKIILGSLNFFILCIFLLYFQAKIPALGDHLPLLVLLYVCNLVLVSISLAISVVVLNLTRTRRVSTPPQCLRIFCNAHFATALGVGHLVPFISKTHTRLDEGVEMRPPNEPRAYPRNPSSWPADMNGEIKDDQTANLVDYDAPYMANAEWILLATMIDRISLIVYVVVNSVILGLCLS